MNSIELEPGAPVPPDCFGGVVAVGNFDGVHRGHHRLLARLRDQSRRLGRPAVVVSLHPHPTTILRPEVAAPILQPPARRAALLAGAGVDRVVFLRTTRALLQLPAEAFFHNLLIGQLGATGMVEGANFAFGCERGGTIPELSRMCRSVGIGLDVVALGDDGGELVSSSRIRRAVQAGEVVEARRLMGRPHRLEGVVVRGAERGRLLGFPTANLADVEAVLPADGVYAVRVELEDGRRFAGACNLGPNPTFSTEERKIEIHLADFVGDLYGARIAADLLQRVRSTRRFNGVDELKDQISRDVGASRAAFAAEPPETPLAELAATAEAWLQDQLHPFDVDVESASATPDFRLEVRLRPALRPSPHASFDLLFRMEERLRRTFPEFSGLDLSEERLAT